MNAGAGSGGRGVDDVPVAHTPEGGYGAVMPPPALEGCTTPLPRGVPDLRGLWRVVQVEAGGVPAPDHPVMGQLQRVEQAGDRVVITSGGIVHDMRADGTEEHGVHDVAAIDKVTPIHVVASFEDGVHVLRPTGLPVEIRRRLDHGEMVWEYLGFTARLRRVDADDELLAAAAEGDTVRAERALEGRARLEARDAGGRTPLLLAAAADHVPMAELLVARGADPNAMDDRHDTPWLVTGVTGSVAMGKVLLAAGADLTVRNRYGGVSVIPASERGHVDYVRWVAGTGIDLDHVNDLGWTALLEAVILGDGSPTYEEVVDVLLMAGASPDLADRDGVTPLDHARAKGHTSLARLLEAAPR